MTDPPKEGHWNLYYIFRLDSQSKPLPPELLILLRNKLFPEAQK